MLAYEGLPQQMFGSEVKMKQETWIWSPEIYIWQMWICYYCNLSKSNCKYLYLFVGFVHCLAVGAVSHELNLLTRRGSEAGNISEEGKCPPMFGAVLLVPDFVSALFLYFYVRLSRMANAPHVVLCWIFVKHVRQCTSALKCENENEKPSYR